MRNLILIVLTTFFFACQNKRPDVNFYKNLYSGEYLNRSEFEDFKKKLAIEYFDSTAKKRQIIFRYEKIVTSSDSTIRPFKYDIIIGNVYVVNSSNARIFEYIDKEFPVRTFLSLKGDSIQIGGHQNKPTLINLWFTSCSGCIAEIPALNKLKEKYGDKMNFVSITFNEKEEIAKFLKKYEFNFEHIAEAGAYLKELGINAYPKNIFINKQGDLMYVEGGLPADSETNVASRQDFENIIQELL
jgi:thiol-disulfide isomerase/thioredoxin